MPGSYTPPPVAGGGGRELLVLDDIFTPAAGFSFTGIDNAATCWVEGAELVVYGNVNNDIAIANTDGLVTVGTFDAEYAAPAALSNTRPEQWTHLFGDDGLLLVRYRVVEGASTILQVRIQETGTISSDSSLAIVGFRFPLASAFA